MDTLRNDSYVDGGSKTFIGGFVAGETAEVQFGPLSNKSTIKKIQFLYGGVASGPVDVVLRIYRYGGISSPSPIVFSNTYSITPDDNLMQEIDFSGELVQFAAGQSMRISLEKTSSGLPFIARDEDGVSAVNGNWIQTGGTWYTSSSLGIVGDFIIRAVVEKEL